MKVAALFFLLVTITFASCKYKEEAMFGKYYKRIQGATEYVELKPDSTYTHYFEGPDTTYQKTGNRCTFDRRKGESDRINFNNWNGDSWASFLYSEGQIHYFPDDDMQDYFRERK